VITNQGPSSATAITLTDTLPAGIGFITATISAGGDCVSGVGDVTCHLASLNVGSSAMATIVITAPATPGLITNTASVTSATPNLGGDNSQVTTVSAVEEPAANLSLAVNVSPAQVTPASRLTYTVVISNLGPSSATAITLTDTLPVGTNFITATIDTGGNLSSSSASRLLTSGFGGNCALSAGDVICHLASLAAGASATATIVITAPTTPGPITNTVFITSTTPNLGGDNSQMTTVTSVRAAVGDLYLPIILRNGPAAAALSRRNELGRSNH
jgi:uncharacterized repeat protein (TIGR01451 family)